MKIGNKEEFRKLGGHIISGRILRAAKNFARYQAGRAASGIREAATSSALIKSLKVARWAARKIDADSEIRDGIDRALTASRELVAMRRQASVVEPYGEPVAAGAGL